MPGRLRIRLAEDEALPGLAAEAVPREAWHEVVLARGGAEALALAGRGRPFDVLVTDLGMPRLDGAALVRRLRAERPALPVVAVTGYAPAEEDHDALRLGGGPPWCSPSPGVRRSWRVRCDGSVSAGTNAHRRHARTVAMPSPRPAPRAIP